jgi:hypothetical protein
MKAELEEEAEKNRKDYEEAQRKLEKMKAISNGKRKMVVKTF